jgi:NADH:ubiquinone oxidoreductase subunit E
MQAALHADRTPAVGKGPMDFDPTQIDAIIAKHGRTASAAIPILQEVQRALRFLPVEAIAHIAL